MPISGVVVSCQPEQGRAVAERIATYGGVEVHGVLPDGQVIAVLEADTVEAEVDLVSTLHQVEGVATVRLAYHHFEDQ